MLKYNTDIQQSVFLPQQLRSHDCVIAVWPRYTPGKSIFLAMMQLGRFLVDE